MPLSQKKTFHDLKFGSCSSVSFDPSASIDPGSLALTAAEDGKSSFPGWSLKVKDNISSIPRKPTLAFQRFANTLASPELSQELYFSTIFSGHQKTSFTKKNSDLKDHCGWTRRPRCHPPRQSLLQLLLHLHEALLGAFTPGLSGPRSEGKGRWGPLEAPKRI